MYSADKFLCKWSNMLEFFSLLVYNDFRWINTWRSRLVWSRAHDWKSCNRHKRFEGSNLSFSAKINEHLFRCSFIFVKHKTCWRDSNKSVKKTILWIVFSDDHIAKRNQALVIWIARAKWTKCQQDRSVKQGIHLWKHFCLAKRKNESLHSYTLLYY